MKKSKRESIDYIKDIADAITKIEQFTQRMDYHAFAKDEKTVFAVIRALKSSARLQRRYRNL